MRPEEKQDILVNHLAILPFLIPLSAVSVAVLLHSRRPLQAGWSLGALLTSCAATAYLAWQVFESGPVVFQMGAWAAPFGITIMADALGVLMALMVQVVTTFGLIYALGAQDAAVRYPFFLPLYLTLVTGLTGAMLTGDIFNIFVMVELMVISAIGLTAISDDPNGAEAALKYLYVGIITSICLLIGIGSLYAAYGTLNMADLATRVAADPSQPLLWIGIVFLFATFGVKAAAFPFHFWQPDFHTVAPTPISAMLSSVVVKFGVYGFLRMTTLLFPAQADVLRDLLLAMGIAGVIYGGLGALGTHNVKRMLAYSTLAQVGLILVGIGWGTPQSIAAALIFTVYFGFPQLRRFTLAIDLVRGRYTDPHSKEHQERVVRNRRGPRQVRAVRWCALLPRRDVAGRSAADERVRLEADAVLRRSCAEHIRGMGGAGGRRRAEPAHPDLRHARVHARVVAATSSAGEGEALRRQPARAHLPDRALHHLRRSGRTAAANFPEDRSMGHAASVVRGCGEPDTC